MKSGASSKKVGSNAALRKALNDVLQSEKLNIDKDTQSYVTTNYQVAKSKDDAEVTREEFENQRKVLEALSATSRHLAIETDIVTILERIAETVAVALGAKKANFWDFTPDHKGAYITAAYGMERHYVEHSIDDPIPLGEAWIGRAMATGQAWSTSDVQKDPLLPKSWLPTVQKQDYHGILCVPLKHADETIGGLCIYHKDPHEYQYFEHEIMSIVGNQAATALLNARTFNELKTERNKIASIINSLHDGLVLCDTNGVVMLINPRAKELLQLHDVDVVGKSMTHIDMEENIMFKNLHAIVDCTLPDYATREIELPVGKATVLMVTYVPVYDDGVRVGVVQVLHDTTEEREIEQMKSNFVSVASHQIRTPLTGVRWAIDMLRSDDTGQLTVEQKAILEKASVVSAHFAKLIDDLLDVSRIDGGRVQYTFVASDLTARVERIYQYLSSVATAKSISFTFLKPEQEIPSVMLDGEKIDMAIQNIFDNALKYVAPQHGHVEVSLRVDGSSAVLEVKDNGIGIPDHQKKFLFNKLFRAENAIRTAPNGSGLGLYIAKQIVAAHGGEITFESTVGVGTVFTVRLPLSVA